MKQGCGDPKEDHAIKISNTRFAQQGRSGRVRWSTQSPSLGIVGASVQANLRRDRGHVARLWMADADGDELAKVATGSKKATGFRHYSWHSSGPRAEQFIAHLRCDHRGGCKHSEVAKTWLRNIHFEVADYADPRLDAVEGSSFGTGWLRGRSDYRCARHRCRERAISPLGDRERCTPSSQPGSCATCFRDSLGGAVWCLRFRGPYSDAGGESNGPFQLTAELHVSVCTYDFATNRDCIGRTGSCRQHGSTRRVRERPESG